MIDFRLLLRRREGSPNHYAKLPTAEGGYSVSIQASDFAYSTPRMNGLSPEEYTNWEVALFDSDGNWVQPRDLVPVPKWAKEWEDGGNAVAGYLPTELVQEIFEEMAMRSAVFAGV